MKYLIIFLYSLLSLFLSFDENEIILVKEKNILKYLSFIIIFLFFELFAQLIINGFIIINNL